MGEPAYVLLGLTLVVGGLLGVLGLAVARFQAAAREAKGHAARRGEGALLSVALQDAVGALKAQEQAMSARAVASEQLSGQIVEHLASGLIVVDRSGAAVIVNPVARQLLGLVPPAPGTSYRAVLGESALSPLVAECLRTGQSVVRRALAVAGADGIRQLDVSVSPFVEEPGPGGAICLFSDQTAVVRLEEQLRLADTLARLGELTAGIAHEFRNGLATIHGYSRLVPLAELPPQYASCIEGIRQETEALGRVVTTFLQYAKPEQATLVPVSLETLVRRAGDDVRPELPDGTTIEVRGTYPPVQGDEVLLRQVFHNLLRNAAEACRVAGTTPGIVIDGTVRDGGRTCRVQVADNGPGIPAGDRAAVLRPFVTTRSGGSGLGLAIVQKIMLAHHGRVDIGAADAGGAAVNLSFPVAET
ncbi:MAG: hypothetical protein HOP14_05210 [Acidobacteria bacterium]|nr:hypothetical protein [Acidobacteriota bacterium]